MQKIRLVICGIPRLLGEIVGTIATTRPNIRIVGQPEDWKELVTAVVRKEADVVVLGCDEEQLPRLGNRLLQEHPFLRIVALTDDGRSAARYELWPQKRALAESSVTALLDAIEEMPAWTRGE